MIQFSEEIGFWSKFVFWYVAVNAVVCVIFTVVVIVGGLFDLRFLFKALKEEVVDETDDGRVISDAQRGAQGGPVQDH